MHTVIYVAIIAPLLIGCVGLSRAENLPLRELARGAFSGIQEEKRLVIQTADEWQELWQNHVRRTQPPAAAPKVDFSSEMVIVATMGRRNTGGYSIEIAEVRSEKNRLVIHLHEKSPAPGGFSIQALTAPFHFVAVPRSDKKPEFVVRQQNNTPPSR